MTYNRINGEDIEFVDEDGNVIVGGEESLIYVNRKGKIISEKRAKKALQSGQYVDSREFYDERLKEKKNESKPEDLHKKGQKQTQDLIANMHDIFAKARKNVATQPDLNMIESDARSDFQPSSKQDYQKKTNSQPLYQSLNQNKTKLHSTQPLYQSTNQNKTNLYSTQPMYQSANQISSAQKDRKKSQETRQQPIIPDESQFFSKLVGSNSKIQEKPVDQYKNQLNPKVSRSKSSKPNYSAYSQVPSSNNIYQSSSKMQLASKNRQNRSLNRTNELTQQMSQTSVNKKSSSSRSIPAQQSIQPPTQQHIQNAYQQPMQHHYNHYQNYQPNYYNRGYYY